MHGARGRRTLAGDIAEHDLATRDHRSLHGVEMHRWRALGAIDRSAAPAGGVVEDRCRCCRGAFTERLR